jgi:hypothetical protein
LASRSSAPPQGQTRFWPRAPPGRKRCPGQRRAASWWFDVKNDYPPFGYLDQKSRLVGYE